jgi:menaquinone-specific isochorismate synthase
LARAFEIRFAQRVNVENALRFLSDHYANCYRFLFEPRPYHAFYGATPEQLIRVEGKQFMTMGLAGSIRRGQQPDEDDLLAERLLTDPKERLEHDLVVQMIREKLAPLACILNVADTPRILRLSNIQHLYTPITGELCEPIGVLPLVELLHPTPAMGGTPSEAALQFIHDIEPVPRGWYASPIGLISAKLDGEFGVAIRSAVSEERRVWLYAGTGIVANSQPQKEWDETTLKFRPMLNALGLTDLKGLA